MNDEFPLEKIHEAIAFALRKHAGQVRKDGKTPYAAHPLRIFATLALKLGVTDGKTLCTALLHDTIEDTSADYDEIAERFGDEVARMVAALTKDQRLPEAEREKRFKEQVAAAPFGARLAKLCDNYDNLGDSLAEGFSAEERKRLAKKKVMHVESLSAGMPEEYRAFADEVKERLAACLR